MNEFETYLLQEKKMAPNTVLAYMRDVREFQTFAAERGLETPADVHHADLVAYLLLLKQEGRAKATVNRKLASLRTWFHYLLERGEIAENPAEGIRSPRIEHKEIAYLSVEEMAHLMEMPDRSLKGIRDRALLEMMYATGMRASEIISAEIDDVNVRMGYVTCSGEHGRARIIPLGRPCREAMENYLYGCREEILLRHPDERALFVNYAGRPITRQGLWKILKEYGEMANLSQPLTPQIIRNSFAVHMLANGADLKSLQELMGHEDITATQVYLSAMKNRIKDVYDRTHPRA